ncbi:MAG TPA: Ig-like domain-containing protein, partial [Candidatus Ruania gallistercoris]|nr:Ig-like domain-containing protein [Candidatus Ruania gallistercoris]
GSEHGYPLNHGGYWFRASYTGEGYTEAEASAKLQVVKADPALEATITPEVEAGETVTIEGQVTAQPDHEGQPQGSLQLVVDGAETGEPVRVAEDDGSFSIEFTAPESWEPGEHTAELVLPARGNFTAGSFTLTTTVVGAPAEVETVVTAQDAEMVYGATGELQATVETADGDAVTSGEVTFLLNGRTVSADVIDGVASVDVTTEDFGSVHGYPLNHGGYWFRASYTGEGYTEAEASAKLQVDKAPVQLDATLSEDEIEAGETITIEGRVSALPGNEGQPQGNLQLVVDGENVGDPIRVDASGNFSTEFITPEDWAAGEHTIVLDYSASANFTATSADLTVTVEEADSGPGSIWEAIEQALRDLFGWLWWLFGGR